MIKEDSVEYMALLKVLKLYAQLEIKQCIGREENYMRKRFKGKAWDRFGN